MSARGFTTPSGRHHITIPYPIPGPDRGPRRAFGAINRRRGRGRAGWRGHLRCKATDEQREQPRRSGAVGAVRRRRNHRPRDRSGPLDVRAGARRDDGDAQGTCTAKSRGCATAPSFGEMSLLTGLSCGAALVTAVTDCALIEIGTEAFRRVVMADQAILERTSWRRSRRAGRARPPPETKAVAGESPETSADLPRPRASVSPALRPDRIPPGVGGVSSMFPPSR